MKKEQLDRVFRAVINEAETHREILKILLVILHATGRIEDYSITKREIAYSADDDMLIAIWKERDMPWDGTHQKAVDILLESLDIVPKMTISYEDLEYLVQTTNGSISRDTDMQMARYKAICKLLLT